MNTVIREVNVKGVITKSNLPVSDYSVNPYTGCTLSYVRNGDSFTQSFDALPTVVNFFYHEEIKKSAVKKS